jgi:predicted small lipoprotein YifL
MRQAICYISILASSLVLFGCGQSGALHMPNDPNYDKRAKYLLYSNTESKPSVPADQNESPVQQQFVAPVATSSDTTP